MCWWCCSESSGEEGGDGGERMEVSKVKQRRRPTREDDIVELSGNKQELLELLVALESAVVDVRREAYLGTMNSEALPTLRQMRKRRTPPLDDRPH
jgi:hypothetical protein